MEYIVLVIVMLLLFFMIKSHQESTESNSIIKLIKKYKIVKVFVLLFVSMLSVYTLEIISASASFANDNAKNELIENEAITAESKKFLSDFYMPVFQKNIDINKLSADSMRVLFSELSNMCPTIVPIKENIKINSKFGYRKLPVAKFHTGIDIHAIYGENVYSTMSGYVDETGYEDIYGHGYGNYIVVKNEIGFKTRYAHLEKILIKKNQQIIKGQLIGTVGLTGNSTGVNLHYEIIQNDVFRDPQIYILMGLKEKQAPINPMKIKDNLEESKLIKAKG